MGRNRKPLWQHQLEGTYRADRHGPRAAPNPTSSIMQKIRAEADAARREMESLMGRHDTKDEPSVYKGLDIGIDETERLLVAASNLSWCLDVDAATIHRWAKTGLMPRPLKVGNSVRWDVRIVRAWIDDGCPPLEGGAGDA